jgi:hypothetical protein
MMTSEWELPVTPLADLNLALTKELKYLWEEQLREKSRAEGEIKGSSEGAVIGLLCCKVKMTTEMTTCRRHWKATKKALSSFSVVPSLLCHLLLRFICHLSSSLEMSAGIVLIAVIILLALAR